MILTIPPHLLMTAALVTFISVGLLGVIAYKAAQILRAQLSRIQATVNRLFQALEKIALTLEDVQFIQGIPSHSFQEMAPRNLIGLKLAEDTEIETLKHSDTDSIKYFTFRQRSVLFLHNSYYHFHYLSKALKARGWDAVTVSYESPVNGANINYYHGEDINLFDADPERFRRRLSLFFESAKHRFDMLHFAGDGLLSFFPDHFGDDEPEDIIAWKNLGKKIAYTISGCNSGIAQSAVAQWSAADNGHTVCDRCAWQNVPEVCRDEKNLAWGRKFDTYCDVTFAEGNPALDYLDSHRVIYEPISMALSPTFWNPNLFIPDKFKLARQPGEILIYHAVGNYQARTGKDGQNIKGTPFVFEAVEKLKADGYPVRLVFVTGVKNTEVRYTQAQADIVVDQLNYGRYGATSREAMMLGKPTICYINAYESKPGHQPLWLNEVPLVSATEKDIYEVLKSLVIDKSKRDHLGQLSRQYALKWHSAPRCAERYEKIYDQLMDYGHVSPDFTRGLFSG